MNTPQVEEFPFKGINVEEIVKKKTNPSVRKIKKLLKYLDIEGIKYTIDGDGDRIELKIKNEKVEIKPYGVVRIRINDNIRIRIRWFEKDNKYNVLLVFVIEDYDMFFNSFNKYYFIEYEGWFYVEVKKGYAIVELKPESKVEISYLDDYTV